MPRYQLAAIAGLSFADSAEWLGLAQTLALVAVAVAVLYAVAMLRAEVRGAGQALKQVIDEQRAIRAEHAEMNRRLARLENGR